MKKCFVYLATNKRNTVIYTGFSKDLSKRMYEHKHKLNPKSFTARYNIEKLVYFEVFFSIDEGRYRERQIKNYSRRKKIELIESKNPQWRNLSNDFGLIL